MDLSSAFRYQKPLPGLIGVEKIMFIYCAFTSALGMLLYQQIDSGYGFLACRAAFVAVTLLLWRLYLRMPCHLTYVARVYFQLGLLAYWYPDIYHFSKLMPNTDPLFAEADQLLFGCQPAVVFSRLLSGRFWSELFYMGYFSYYVMIIAAALYATFVHFRRFDRTTTIILCSFMLYYTVYLFLQSAGPQFYFPKIGMEQAMAGNFPDVGDWFRFHPELTHTQTGGGFFKSLVEAAQKSEFPIAAFPSSHVGMATIILILVRRMSRPLTWVFLPFYVILCLSTVYIGAHYAVDVVGGWVSAVIIYWLSKSIYQSKFIHRPKNFGTWHSHKHHHHHSHH